MAFGVHAEHEHYKWWALSCTSLGMLLATINSGTLIIALPDLERAPAHEHPHARLGDPRLHDRLDRARAHGGAALATSSAASGPTSRGFVVFALASLGAGFAADGTQLILWRVVQGIGGAFLFANAAALVTDAFPQGAARPGDGHEHHGRRVGLVLGPVLGGALVAISWHWVFWFNVPFGLAGGLWGALVLRELAKPDSVRGFDLLGTATFVVGLTGLVLGISKGGTRGWDDPLVDRRPRRRASVLLPLFVLDRARTAARRCSTSRSSATGCSRRPPARRSSTGSRASR